MRERTKEASRISRHLCQKSWNCVLTPSWSVWHSSTKRGTDRRKTPT